MTSAKRPGGGSADKDRFAALLAAVSGSDRVVVATHDNPDPDALASAAGLRAVLERSIETPVVTTFGGIIGRAENRSLMEMLGVPFERIEGFEFQAGDAVALVDGQPGSGNTAFGPGSRLAVVIDHHPAREGPLAAYHDVRESYGACSTMIVELMRAGDIEPDEALATGLFYAIQSETLDLGREASPADIEASVYLYPRTDPAALSSIRHARVPRGLFRSLHDGLERAWQRGGVVCVPVGRLEYPDLVAQLADFFLRVQGVDWVVAIGRHEQDVLISVRADRPGANAGSIVRAVVGDRGSAGGHGQMAGGRVRAAGLGEAEVKSLVEAMFDDFCRHTGVIEQPREPLLLPGGST